MSVKERIQKVVATMAGAGIDTLIVLNGAVHAFQRSNAVMLLAGFRSIGDSLVVLRADGTSTLVVTPAWELPRAKSAAHTTQIEAADDLRAALERVIDSVAAAPERLGVVGVSSLGYADALWLTERLRDSLRRFDSEFATATCRKTAAEIANAERATWIAEQGYARLLKHARPGVREIELAEDICAAMCELGADDNFIMLSASAHNRAVRPPGSRAIERGDLILCEISPSFGGQFTQICRTARVGSAPSRFAEKYELLRSSFANGMRAAVPGTRVSELVDQINANLIAAGYGEFCAPPHMRVRGHGLGFGSVEPGDLSSWSETTIDRDVVFVIHPNQYFPETGYMMCGDPILVGQDGARCLAARPAVFDQLELCA